MRRHAVRALGICVIALLWSGNVVAGLQAIVKNVQRGSTTMAGATAAGNLQQKDITLITFDPTKAYVIGSSRTTVSDPDRRVTFELVGTNTLRLSCY